MKTILNLSLILLGSFSLVACSYFNANDEMELKGKPAAVIDVTNTNMDSPPPAATAAPVEDVTIETQHSGPPPKMEDVVKDSTDGDVQLFPLDNNGAPDADAQPAPAGNPDVDTFSPDDAKSIDSVGAIPASVPPADVISTDPSVDVFPLDGPMPGPQSSAAVTISPGVDIVSGDMGDRAVVYFERDSKRLGAKDLEELANLVAGHTIANGVAVEGYASTESGIKDPVQRKIANLKVSMTRAINVASALIEKGVPAELISTVAYGEANPAASPAKSRRVEIRGLSGH